MKTQIDDEATTELSGPTGRARIGKIAKLPGALREELNERMANGEATEAILKWLNGHPAARARLEAHHGGNPITADNLSRWRQGGFAGWLENQRTREAISMMSEACRNISQKDRDALPNQLSLVVMARMTVEVQRFQEMPEGALKSEAWRELVSALLQLRRGEFYAERMRLEREKLFPEKREEDRMSLMEKEQQIRQILGIGGPIWNHITHGWEGPGAEEKMEEEEIEQQVRADMRRRKAARAAAAVAAANPTAPAPCPIAPAAEPAEAKPGPTAPEPKPTVPEPEAVVTQAEPALKEPEAVMPEPDTVAPEPEAPAPEPKAVVPEPKPAVQASNPDVLTRLPPLLARNPAVMARNGAVLGRELAEECSAGK